MGDSEGIIERPLVVLFKGDGKEFTLRSDENKASWVLNGIVMKDSVYTPGNSVEFEVSLTDADWVVTKQSICESPASSRALSNLMVDVWRWTAFFEKHGIEEVFKKAQKEHEIPWCTWDRDQVIEYLMNEFKIDIDEALLSIADAITWEEFINPLRVISAVEAIFLGIARQAHDETAKQWATRLN